jgi:hypothetical protein
MTKATKMTINQVVSSLFNDTTPLLAYGIDEGKIDAVESRNPQLAKQYPWQDNAKVA